MLVRPSRSVTLLSSAIALVLISGCQTARVIPPAPLPQTPSSAVTAPSSVTEKVLGEGLYQMALFPASSTLYVASAQRFNKDNGGVLYKVNPMTLDVTGVTHTDLKNFGLASQVDNKFFYTTNTLDGMISKIAVHNGEVVDRLIVGKKNQRGQWDRVREMLWVGDKLYIGAVTNPGYITVVDTRSFTVTARIDHAGKWITGLLYSPTTQRLYAANGSGEILVINPSTHRIEKRWTTGESSQNLFLNLAEDPATHRLFVTDDSQGKATYVFDQLSGKMIKKIPGDSLGIRFNRQRNELYIGQRESKQVVSLDATDYRVKKRWHFAGFPNSLLLSDGGESLFVTVKQDFNQDYSTKGPDSLVRIALSSEQ